MSAGDPGDVRASRPFSWRRALLHGLVPVAVAVLAGIALLGLERVADPERFGRGVGQLAVFLLLAGMGISWLGQTGRRTGATIAAAVLGVGLVALIAVAITGGSRWGPQPLTEAERAPLERTAGAEGGLLRHPTLGFSLRDPGPQFAPLSGPQAAEIAERLANTPEQHAYGFVAASTGQALVVLVSKGVSDRADLEGLSTGLRIGFAGQLEGTVLRDEQSWEDGRGEAWFEGELPGQGFFEVHTVAARLGGEEAPFAISALAITASRGALSPVLQSLRAP